MIADSALKKMLKENLERKREVKKCIRDKKRWLKKQDNFPDKGRQTFKDEIVHERGEKK